jgi:hypothetical protein
MIRFDLLFHLRLDLLEIIGRNAVRKIDIVIKRYRLAARPRTGLPARSSKWPSPAHERRMTQTLDVCHLRAHLGSFAFFLHPIGR